jgi:hypothetical protein
MVQRGCRAVGVTQQNGHAHRRHPATQVDAAVMEDRMFLGLEREAAYVDIACALLTHWAAIAVQKEVLP